ncbi:hypothetical protein [Arthrobacter sp. TMN-50]
MSNPVESGQPEEGTRSGTLRKVAAGVLVCALALALGIGYLLANRPGTDATANSTPTPAATSSPHSTGSAPGTASEESAEPTPTEPVTEEEPTTAAASDEGSAPAAVPAEEEAAEEAPAEEDTTEEAPAEEEAAEEEAAEEAPAEEDTAEADEPTASDAELAAIEQPVSEPVDLEEPAVVADGISAKITTMESIEAEAFGIGEIAGPALRFVITVENTTGEAVTLSNSVVNVEYGPERLPAVQLTGSDATVFPATVDAGGSVSATLVFSIPVDQRDQVRILLNMEASSPIAAFEGAAPGEEG